ncbi:MAG: hypothetical protein WAV53_12775, partial [Anaerolineae bacterium]
MEVLRQRMPDFWQRRATEGATTQQFNVFGYPLLLTTNSQRLVTACAAWVAKFSTAPLAAAEAPMQISLFERQAADRSRGRAETAEWDAVNLEGESPFTYDGHGDWIAISAGRDGHVLADLRKQEAIGFVAPSLAAQTALVSKFIFGTVLYNLLTRRAGLLQWHAVALVHEDTVLLLIGHDNSGKSTTALTLLHAGFTLLADGLIYTRLDAAGVEVLASPVGELRVRPGAFDFFPHLRQQAVALNTWEGEKYRLDLAQVFPGRYTSASPRVTRLLPLFVSVGQRLATHITPLTAGQALERAIPALGWWDSLPFLETVLHHAHTLLARHPAFALEVGWERDALVASISGLITSGAQADSENHV